MPDVTISSDFSLLLLIPIAVLLIYILYKLFLTTQKKIDEKLRWFQFGLRFFLYFSLIFLIWNPKIEFKSKKEIAKEDFIYIDNSYSILLADSLVKNKTSRLLNNSKIISIYSNNGKILKDSLTFKEENSNFTFSKYDFKKKYDSFYCFTDLNFSQTKDIKNLLEFSKQFPINKKTIIFPKKKSQNIDYSILNAEFFTEDSTLFLLIDLKRKGDTRKFKVNIKTTSQKKEINFNATFTKNSNYLSKKIKLPFNYCKDSLSINLKTQTKEITTYNNNFLLKKESEIIHKKIILLANKPSIDLRFIQLQLEDSDLDFRRYNLKDFLNYTNKNSDFKNSILIIYSLFDSENNIKKLQKEITKFKEIVFVPTNINDFKNLNKLFSNQIFKNITLKSSIEPFLTNDILNFLKTQSLQNKLEINDNDFHKISAFNYQINNSINSIKTGIVSKKSKQNLIEFIHINKKRITILNMIDFWPLLFKTKDTQKVFNNIFNNLFNFLTLKNSSKNIYLITPSSSTSLLSKKEYELRIKIYDDLLTPLDDKIKVDAIFSKNKKLKLEYDNSDKLFKGIISFNKAGKDSIKISAENSHFHKKAKFYVQIIKNNFELERIGLNKELANFFKNEKQFKIISLDEAKKIKRKTNKLSIDKKISFSFKNSKIFLSFIFIMFLLDIFLAKWKGWE